MTCSLYAYSESTDLHSENSISIYYAKCITK